MDVTNKNKLEHQHTWFAKSILNAMSTVVPKQRRATETAPGADSWRADRPGVPAARLAPAAGEVHFIVGTVLDGRLVRSHCHFS